MDIHEFHKYNRLVKRDLVEPLACEVCGFDLITRATHAGEPLLQCPVCNVIIQPGLKIYDRVRLINQEFYT